ncbi:hypothetical protein [Streptomyces sp. NPDC088748]|uniref:hypothetical protein n=1 Tax=Streptomyces sp. NPDC088748 TaxID=3365887 RepID=UPI0038209EAA
MTWTAFVDASFYWAYWTLFEAMWIGMLWMTRSRVPGRAVCRIPGLRNVRRRACETRVDALLAVLAQHGVPVGDRPDRKQLVERWHGFVAGTCAAVPFQTVPLLIAWAPFLPLRPAPNDAGLASLWMFVALACYGTVSITLMAADARAVAVSDAAGLVTAKAALFLEVLVLPAGQRSHYSALDTQGRAFSQMCRALRFQARYTTRELPSPLRERARHDTERLIATLGQHVERSLLSEGEERNNAVREMAHVVSSVLQHSCRRRDQRNSLVVVGGHLSASALAVATVVPAQAPVFWHRVLRAGGWLMAAAALFAGAALLPSGGVATDVMAVMGLLSIAAVVPPLRAVLDRARGGFLSGPTLGVGPAAEPCWPSQNSAAPPPATHADEPDVAGV